MDGKSCTPSFSWAALHLRAMNMLYEAIKERGSMVAVPSSAIETMGLGGLLGATALAKEH